MFRGLVRVRRDLFRRAVRARWTTAGFADVRPAYAATVRTAIAWASPRSASSVRAHDEGGQDRPCCGHRSKSREHQRTFRRGVSLLNCFSSRQAASSRRKPAGAPSRGHTLPARPGGRMRPRLGSPLHWPLGGADAPPECAGLPPTQAIRKMTGIAAH
jgi:hypothetical protein